MLRDIKELRGLKRLTYQTTALLACGCVLLDKSFLRGMEREYFRRCVNYMICEYNSGNKSFKKYGDFVKQTAELQKKTKAKHLMDSMQLYAVIIGSAWYEPNKNISKLTLSQIATQNSTKEGESGQDRESTPFKH